MDLTTSYFAGGRGKTTTHIGINPGVGNTFELAFSNIQVNQLIFATANLQTDANAADRVISLYILRGINPLHFCIAPKVQIANETLTYYWGLQQPYLDMSTEASLVQTNLSDKFRILPDDIIKINVANMQITDRLTNLRFVTEAHLII